MARRTYVSRRLCEAGEPRMVETGAQRHLTKHAHPPKDDRGWGILFATEALWAQVGKRVEGGEEEAATTAPGDQCGC